jgi:hypothetical protein
VTIRIFSSSLAFPALIFLSFFSFARAKEKNQKKSTADFDAEHVLG